MNQTPSQPTYIDLTKEGRPETMNLFSHVHTYLSSEWQKAHFLLACKGISIPNQMYDTPSYQEFLRLEFPSSAIDDTIADSICGVSTVCQSILEGGTEAFVAKVFEKMRMSFWNWKYLHLNRHSLNDSIRGKRARWKVLSLKRNPRMLKVSFSIIL